MALHEAILTNIIFAILLASCYVLLPVFFAAVFALDGILIVHTYITALLRSAYHDIVSRCIHWVALPTVLLVLTTIYWIESRRIEIISAASLSWTHLCAKSDTIKTMMMDHAVLPICIMKIMDAARDYNISFARILIEDSDAELKGNRPVARVRTREQDRLRRCIDDLEALEADDLPENMTTEHAMLLILTRRAAADGYGCVYYRLLEDHDPVGPAQLVETQQYEIMRPHTNYCRLYISEMNLFRTDEPDCAICYCPLEIGQAMITHETCRRTFHTLCLNDSLWREKMCPFDRENLVLRSNALGTTPVLDLRMTAGAEQEQVEIHAPDRRLADYVERQLPHDEDQNEQRIGLVGVGTNGPLYLIREGAWNEAPRVVRGAEMPGLVAPRNQVPRNQGQQQGRRPADNRPNRNNARGRGPPRRAWR